MADFAQMESLWWYNNVRRHWCNLRLRVIWHVAKLRGEKVPKILPQAGRISRGALAWAKGEIKRLDLDKE